MGANKQGVLWFVLVVCGLAQSSFCDDTSQAHLSVCMSELASKINRSYSDPEVVDKYFVVKELLRLYLDQCPVSNVTVERPIRLLVLEAPFSAHLHQAAISWESSTGIHMELFELSAAEINVAPRPLKSTQQPYAALLKFDAWIMKAQYSGQVAQLGGLSWLDDAIREDTGLDWAGVSAAVRRAALHGGGGAHVAGLPLDGDTLLLYYRQDIFDSANFKVPITWPELFDTADALPDAGFDGDGEKLWGLCLDVQIGCHPGALLSAILAPYVQTAGPQEGVFVEPSSLSPLVCNAAMYEALRLLAEVARRSPPLPKLAATLGRSCSGPPPEFVSGSCAMAIGYGDTFKRSKSSLIRGRVAAALLPGSTQVLPRPGPSRQLWSRQAHSRTAGSKDTEPEDTGLQNCTAQLCPLAALELDMVGQRVLVNRVPLMPASQWIGAVNGAVPGNVQLAALRFLASLSSAAVSLPAVLDPLSGLHPYHALHFNATPWVDAGYEEGDVRSYLDALRAAQSSGNIALDLRMQAGQTVRSAFDEAARRMVVEGPYAPDVAAVMSDLCDAVERAFVAAGKRDDVRAAYWADIGYTPQGTSQEEEVWSSYRAGSSAAAASLLQSNPTPPASARDITPVTQPRFADYQSTSTGQAGDGTADGGNGSGNRVVVVSLLSLLIGCGLLALLLLFAVQRQRHRDLFGAVVAPGPGQDTTLLVTDIQGSTQLWEMLPADVMDRALRMHQAVLRSALRRHAGYESATEGDSFVLAFHSPRSALAFALEAQTELLHLPWPRELLATPACCPQWMAPGPSDLSMAGTACLCRARSMSLSGWLRYIGGGTSTGDDSDTAPLVDNGSPPGTAESRHTTRSAGDAAPEMMTFAQALAQQHTLSLEEEPGSVLAFRGLRVRMGLHMGVCGSTRLCSNGHAGRLQHSGQGLQVAKMVTDAALGGMILATGDVFERLHAEQLNNCLVIHMGQHHLKDYHSTGPHHLYQLLAPALRCRAAVLTTLNTPSQVLPGALDALAGGWLAVSFMKVAGVQQLLAWDGDVTSDALRRWRHVAEHEMRRHKGYLVEATDEFMLVAFPVSSSALLWGLQVQQRLLAADWPPALLRHELCEEVSVTSVDDTGATCNHAVLRGLRLKTGVDYGRAIYELHPVTGRMSYRGRVMNRASRVAGMAAGGQVLVTSDGWRAAQDHTAILAADITATSLGMQELKGVSGHIEVYSCRTGCSLVRSRRPSAASASDATCCVSVATAAAAAAVATAAVLAPVAGLGQAALPAHCMSVDKLVAAAWLQAAAAVPLPRGGGSLSAHSSLDSTMSLGAPCDDMQLPRRGSFRWGPSGTGGADGSNATSFSATPGYCEAADCGACALSAMAPAQASMECDALLGLQANDVDGADTLGNYSRRRLVAEAARPAQLQCGSGPSSPLRQSAPPSPTFHLVPSPRCGCPHHSHRCRAVAGSPPHHARHPGQRSAVNISDQPSTPPCCHPPGRRNAHAAASHSRTGCSVGGAQCHCPQAPQIELPQNLDIFGRIGRSAGTMSPLGNASDASGPGLDMGPDQVLDMSSSTSTDLSDLVDYWPSPRGAAAALAARLSARDVGALPPLPPPGPATAAASLGRAESLLLPANGEWVRPPPVRTHPRARCGCCWYGDGAIAIAACSRRTSTTGSNWCDAAALAGGGSDTGQYGVNGPPRRRSLEVARRASDSGMALQHRRRRGTRSGASSPGMVGASSPLGFSSGGEGSRSFRFDCAPHASASPQSTPVLQAAAALPTLPAPHGMLPLLWSSGAEAPRRPHRRRAYSTGGDVTSLSSIDADRLLGTLTLLALMSPFPNFHAAHAATQAATQQDQASKGSGLATTAVAPAVLELVDHTLPVELAATPLSEPLTGLQAEDCSGVHSHG